MSTAFFLRFCVLLALLLTSNAVGVQVLQGAGILSVVYFKATLRLIMMAQLDSFEFSLNPFLL
jgi:hypothetical protein